MAALFGRRASRDIVYDRDAFYAMAGRQTWCRALEGVIGRLNTSYVIGMVFAKFDGGTGRITVPAAQAAGYPQTIDLYFRAEFEQIARKRAYVDELREQARGGALRGRLQAQTMPETDYGGLPRVALPFESQVPDIHRAYRWVSRSWQGDGREVLLSVITQHVVMERGRTALGRDDKPLRAIHRRVAPNAPAWRSPNYMTSYPSSVGGSWLLRYIFSTTADGPWPAAGAAGWEDWALFYLGAIVTVQGFTDGNKRVGRLAYAITLLKGEREFRAPTVALENELYRM